MYLIKGTFKYLSLLIVVNLSVYTLQNPETLLPADLSLQPLITFLSSSLDLVEKFIFTHKAHGLVSKFFVTKYHSA